MTEKVTITGLNRVTTPKPNNGGSTVIAWFNCEARGIAFTGCALARTAKGGLAAWPPKLDGPEMDRRSVKIIDHSLRHAMMLHAREAYRALGGTDAEYIGTSIPNPPYDDEPATDDDLTGVRAFIGATDG
ncbi:hypothetical protein ACX0GZ_04625 [Sphingomonas aestuarii]